MADVHHPDGNNEVGDIEQNTPPAPDHAPPETPTIAAASSPAAAASDSMFVTILILVSVALYVPFAAAYTIIVFSLLGKDKTPSELFRPKDKRSGGIYSNLLQSHSSTKVKLRGVICVIACRVGCAFLLLLLLSLYLPSLKRVTLLGLLLSKWSMLGIIVSFCYPYFIYSFGVFAIVFVDQVLTKSHAGFYFCMGLIDSVSSLINIATILVVWMLCFHRQLQGGGSTSTTVDKYTTVTLSLVLVGAFLWVLKSAVLLRWKAKAIYTRFRGRILMAGFRLFFLTLILESKKMHRLLPWRYKQDGDDWYVIHDPNPDEEELLQNTTTVIAFAGSSKRNIQARIISSHHVSFEQMNELAQSLTSLAKEPLRDDDAQIFNILDVYRRKIGAEKYVTEEKIRQLVKGDDANLLLEELQAEYPSKEIHQVPFQKWVVDAHQSCVAVSYTLVDAFAMVKVLNMILTSCLIALVILIWLLVTELATTKVIVVIGSPFVALTFVFGDTLKTFFQGFIFAFINHPFDIGDRCIIDGDEVEVKRVNIMTTTCLKIGTKEKLLYPNSDLATKLIINLEGKPEPTDFIEVVLNSSIKTSDVIKLEKHIARFLDAPEQAGSFEQSCRVVVKEMGNDDLKIIIYFQHTMDGKDVSHSQFLEKKETQRSKLFIEIRRFLDNLNTQVANQINSTFSVTKNA